MRIFAGQEQCMQQLQSTYKNAGVHDRNGTTLERQTLRTIQFCAEVHNVEQMARYTCPAEIGAGQRAAGTPASNINRALSRN